MDPRLLSSVSLQPRGPYLVDHHRLPSDGGFPQQHFHLQEQQHLGAGLPLRAPAVAAPPPAPLGSYSAGAPPAAGGSHPSGQGFYAGDSLVGSGARAAFGEASRLLGGVAVPPGYKLVPIGQPGAPDLQLGYQSAPAAQQGYERAPAVQQGYERAPAVQQQGYERAPAVQQGYVGGPAVHQGYDRAPAVQQGYGGGPALLQGYDRVPAVQQGYGGGPAVHQGYDRAPAVQQQKFELNPPEYSYPGAKPLADAGALIAPGARQVNRMAESPLIREMYLSPPLLPRLHSQPKLPPAAAPLYRRPAYRVVRQQGEQLIPMYGRTPEFGRDLGQPWDNNPSWDGRVAAMLNPARASQMPRAQMPRVERSRKKAKISKDKSTSAAVGEAKSKSPERAPGWCSVCQITCDTALILKQHLAGKRHKKQLNKKKKDSQEVINKNSDNQVMKEHEDNKSTAVKLGLAATVAAAIGNSKNRKRNRDNAQAEKELTEAAISNGEQTENNNDVVKPNSYEKCEVCDVTCANRAILEAHFAGRRHAARIKNLLNKGDGTERSDIQIAVADGTSVEQTIDGAVNTAGEEYAQTADGDLNTVGKEDKPAIVSELLQETAKTETLVAVKEE